MKRTLNAMQQRFRREGYTDFAFIWVAENKRNENPHVHLLTNHRVPRAQFDVFAAWVESLWGHGWVTIERVRKPASAGRYMLKAVGYALKGQDGEQGTIAGNRYGISRNIATHEETVDLQDCELAAEVLVAFGRSLSDGEGVRQLAEGVYLTRYGVALGPGTTDEQIASLVAHLGGGALPG
ncbi:MAG: hypothetical protein FDZ75_02445 [Actinobacteria bacterium]|nr:MAG: hypothetical protein FDZ75_02445 [Actinomycetota bacterium]